MNLKVNYDLLATCRAFAFDGTFVRAVPHGSGHINDTWAVTYERPAGPVRYILQRINHEVFTDPARVMRNIEHVTRHVRSRLEASGASDIDRRTLTLVPTTAGDSCHVDAEGNTWRSYVFIEDARTYDEVQSVHQAYEAAKAFGGFTRRIADLPHESLTETIPGFHDTRARFRSLLDAIQADRANRATQAVAEITYALEREAIVDTLHDLHTSGQVPLVATHNDTKLNNVMIDDVTGEGLCVIDLDTVMPGLSLYDFGDMGRTALRPCPEDERDLSRVRARMDVFEAITSGYLIAAGDGMNPVEEDHLARAVQVITLETGIRFLTDHLQGDVYFKTHRPGHNLDRARVQFRMVQSLEDQMDTMQAIVARSARGDGYRPDRGR